MAKITEFKTLDDASISKKIEELRVEIFNLKLQKTTTGLEKPHRITEAKRDIARLYTVLNQRNGK